MSAGELRKEGQGGRAIAARLGERSRGRRHVIFEGPSTSDANRSVAGLTERAPVLRMRRLGCQIMRLDQANIGAMPRRTCKRSRGNIATDSSGAMLGKGEILWKCHRCCFDRITMTGASFGAHLPEFRRSTICKRLGCANHP